MVVQSLIHSDFGVMCVQPGVASVYCTIVQQTKEGVEFYLKRFPELEGKTFQEARRLFDDAVLCGYIRTGEGGEPLMHLNCSDEDVLEASDRVIALSQDGLALTLALLCAASLKSV